MNNLGSNLSPDDVPRNLLFLGVLPGGDGDACLLEMDLLPGNSRSHNFDHLRVTDIEMVDITREFTSVSLMTNYYLHILKSYEEK